MLVGMTLISFTLSQAVPADPITANLGEQAASNPEVVAAFRHRWGLDRPLPEQYGIYLWNVLHGDLGRSITTKQPVVQDLRRHLPATIELAVAAMAISIVVGIPLGVIAAARRDGFVDQIARVVSLIGVSMPIFWLGLVAIVVFYSWAGWAPPPGRLSARLEPPPFVTGFVLIDALVAGRSDVVKDSLKHLILPALVLSSYSLGVITRVMRAGMLEVLGEDYVRTARAKGVDERAVMIRHAARNSLIPTLTVIGLSFGGLLSGAVVTESVFSWPGLGLYAFRSATSLDFPAIMGVGIVVATVYVLVNLAVDLAYGLLDPRIRVGD
ncbi:MAG: dipeptide transport system permease protein dppB [Thermomicrobiales bacterium]|jgi:peptide/nickel transport system permease protein|nr:dipeptide transport system permease protein dppB [Thermomicrobiales bacterium]MDF2759401.1 dipeptide transport system permease protein dppB [Thermomicrobiales bacterium]